MKILSGNRIQIDGDKRKGFFTASTTTGNVEISLNCDGLSETAFDREWAAVKDKIKEKIKFPEIKKKKKEEPVA